MQHLFILFILNLSIPFSLVAQQSRPSRFGSTEDYKRLWYLNSQYIQAWIHSDTGMYNRLLWAEDFVHQSGANGYLYPKNEIIKIFGNKRFEQINWFYAENTRIQFINDHAAMVFSRPPYFGKGDTTESFSQYNDVYIKRNGNWICVSANITNINPSHTTLPTLSTLPPRPDLISIIKGNDEDREDILNIHQEARTLLEKRDYKKVMHILDDDFMMLDSDGTLLSKLLVVERFKKDRTKNPTSYRFINITVRFVATGIAMVHGAMIFESKEHGTTGIQFNDIFVKRDRGWSLVSSNNTPIKN